MLNLVLIAVVVGLTLAVLLYVGGRFLQGYIYTEPSQDLYWQAPAAGLVMGAFFFLWSLMNYNAAGATTRDIPYDVLHKFSPRVERFKEPVKDIWAIKKNGDKIHYVSRRTGQTSWQYVDPTYSPPRPWRDDGVEAIQIVIDQENYVFKRVKGTQGSYGEYVNDKGWIMKEYGDGPTGIPSMFRWGRFLTVMFLNFMHFVLWWLCLWLLMRFTWGHAMGLAMVMWLIFTLMILPMLLENAALEAERRARPPSPEVIMIRSMPECA